MPVYLCQSGSGHSEPWCHGIQVYQSPFPIDQEAKADKETNQLVVATELNAEQPSAGNPLRRVRHSELVLVDDVCIAYDRYWLRLRWPGHHGGFSGYIAMGLVSETPEKGKSRTNCGWRRCSMGDLPNTGSFKELPTFDQQADESDDPNQEETGSMPPSEPMESSGPHVLTCIRTGLSFPTSAAMNLMSTYDDGVSPPVALTPFSLEPVFCRICREGLHDDADEEQPSPAGAEDPGDEDQGRDPSSHSLGEQDMMTGELIAVTTEQTSKGPEQPHPSYSVNADALQNPLLAPCECSGSMAFVHYLCVEQWRCRSRHPEAHHGLNCETCGTPYSLPPPSERQAHVVEQEDWLEAMPPHVMAALRQPHFCWQIGAAIVRRRALRPLAPIFMSPVVALYCRARRLLKKRGVARRRWACSLCRRRARWKCVRCLRSYYCSRQCQNVSWHIVHKHVCYKPMRFWMSVLVYSVLAIVAFPGILRDPVMYALGLASVPMSFIVMGVIGGGFAMAMKKAAGVDLRGRMLETVVVACTLYLSFVSWRLIQGYFHTSSACMGVFGSYTIPLDELPSWTMLNFVHYILYVDRLLCLWVDAMPRRFAWDWVSAALCTGKNDGCFEHLSHANPYFFLASGGEKCAADLSFMCWLYLTAGVTFIGSAIWKHRERQRRRQGRRPMRGEPRPHED